MRKWMIVILTVCWVTASHPAWGQETLFEMTFSADKNQITVGDEITLSIDILHGTNFELLPLPKKLKLAPFEIKQIARLPAKSGNQGTSEGFRVVLTIFELGEFTIPKFPIRFIDPRGEKAVVYTDEWPIVVMSVRGGEEDTGQLRPIKGPHTLVLPWSPKRILIVAALSLLGVFLFFMIWRFLTRRLAAWRQDRRTPYQRALDDLKELAEARFLETGRAKMYYTRISDILKIYLIKQFHVGSTDLTTREYLRCAEKEEILTPLTDDIQTVLKESDLVKFAKWSPTTEVSRKILSSTRRVVETSMERYLARKESSTPEEAQK